jgi:oxaloacetate decarboxylase gamma subunit
MLEYSIYVNFPIPLGLNLAGCSGMIDPRLTYIGGTMTIMEMLAQSGVLTVLGMGVVFGFLIIMIIAISTVGKIIQSISKDQPAIAPAGVAAPPTGNDAPVTAAISAAVNEYRKAK